MTTSELEPGDVLIWCNRRRGFARNWFSIAQRIFTRTRFTHVSLYMGNFGHYRTTQLEAKLCVTVTPFRLNVYETVPELSDLEDLRIFRFDRAPSLDRTTAMALTFLRTAGTDYAFLQLLTFIRRWIWETAWVRWLFGWIPMLLGRRRYIAWALPPWPVRLWRRILGRTRFGWWRFVEPRTWGVWFPAGAVCSEVGWLFLDNLANAMPEYRFGLHDEFGQNAFNSGDMFTVCVRHARLIYVHDRAPASFNDRYAPFENARAVGTPLRRPLFSR